MMQRFRSIVPECMGIAVLLIIWQVFSVLYPKFLLPSPATTFADTLEVLVSQEFWSNASVTLRRTLTGSGAAFLVASIVAWVSATYAPGRKALWPIILFANAFPGIVATFVAVVVLGSYGPVALCVSLMLVGPLLFFVLYPGFVGVRKEYREVASVFRLTRWVYFRSVMMPQLMPYIFAAMRTGIANGWKIVVTAEVFTLGGGIGYKILTYFNLFSLRHVFSWLLAFLLVIFVIEYMIVLPLERRIVRTT